MKLHGHVEGYLEVFQAYIKVKQMILFSLKKKLHTLDVKKMKTYRSKLSKPQKIKK